MTCPSLLRRRPEETETLGHLSHGHAHSAGEVAHVVSEQVRRDDTWGQFIRFVLVGGSSTAVYALLFLGLNAFGYLPAHVVATVASAAPGPVQTTGPDSVTADPLPTVQINGVVWSQAVVGNKVFAGGNFTKARPAGAAVGTV